MYVIVRRLHLTACLLPGEYGDDPDNFSAFASFHLIGSLIGVLTFRYIYYGSDPCTLINMKTKYSAVDYGNKTAKQKQNDVHI